MKHTYQKQFQKLQEQFLNAIRLHPEEDFLAKFETHPFRSNLLERTSCRMKAYNTSYYSRLCNVASDYLFDTCREIIGAELLYELLQEYYVDVGSNASDLVDTGRWFPDFLMEKKPDVTREFPFLIDLCQLSILYWDLMFAKEEALPTITAAELSHLDPQKVFLTKNHVFFTSQHAIHDIWQEAQKRLQHQDSKPFMEVQQQGILIIRKQGIYFEFLSVPKPLFLFMKYFSEGKSLDQAIESGFEEDMQGFDVAVFQQWIADLTQREALRLF